MQIGEVAKRTSPTVDAIRFYEKRRLLPKAVRSAGRFGYAETAPSSDFASSSKCRHSASPLREVGELIQLQERAVLRRKASRTRSQGTND